MTFVVSLLMGGGLLQVSINWFEPRTEVHVSISGTFAEEFPPRTFLEKGISSQGNQPRIRFRAEDEHLDLLVSQLLVEQPSTRLRNVSFPSQNKFELLLTHPTEEELSGEAESRRWEELVAIVLESNYRLSRALEVDEVQVFSSAVETVASSYPIIFFSIIFATLATVALLTLQAVFILKKQAELGK